MRALQNAAVMFCIACICAEVTVLLVGRGWAHKCIKAVAGLYILVVFFHTMPQLKAEGQRLVVSARPAVQFQSMETSLLEETARQLESTLQQECLQRFGLSVKLEITLCQNEERVEAERVVLYVPADSTAEARGRAAEYLHSALSMEPVVKVQEGAA